MRSIYLSDLPTLSLRDLEKIGLLPLPTREETRRGNVTLSYSVGESKSVYRFEVEVSSFNDGTGSLFFRYKREGVTIRYSYPLIERESNLPSGGSYWKISYRDRISSKLYLYNGYFFTRTSLPFMYESSAQSKRWREIEKEGTFNGVEEIFRKGGKVHYRGELTPYGEKLCRNWDKIERVYSIFQIPKGKRRSVSVLWDIIQRSSSDC